MDSTAGIVSLQIGSRREGFWHVLAHHLVHVVLVLEVGGCLRSWSLLHKIATLASLLLLQSFIFIFILLLLGRRLVSHECWGLFLEQLLLLSCERVVVLVEHGLLWVILSTIVKVI